MKESREPVVASQADPFIVSLSLSLSLPIVWLPRSWMGRVPPLPSALQDHGSHARLGILPRCMPQCHIA
eukprot:1428247-Pyramimonas_sp.AAC.1